jgi:glycosyltransferase involved in cell wall biosynthesis
MVTTKALVWSSSKLRLAPNLCLQGGLVAAAHNVDDVIGERVDGESIEAIALALQLLLTNSALCRRLGEAGPKRTQAEFSWERMAEKIRDFENESSFAKQ